MNLTYLNNLIKLWNKKSNLFPLNIRIEQKIQFFFEKTSRKTKTTNNLEGEKFDFFSFSLQIEFILFTLLFFFAFFFVCLFRFILRADLWIYVSNSVGRYQHSSFRFLSIRLDIVYLLKLLTYEIQSTVYGTRW